MNGTKMIIPIMGRELILVGTAHVSQESVNEVIETIKEEKPALVCVELDEGRYAAITQRENWEKLDMVKVFRERKGFLLMASLVLAGFQRRMGAELGVRPGEEMKAALDVAGELNIPYVLCDREVQITLRRAWANCGLWNKCKLLAALLASAFSTEKLDAKEIEELKKQSELDGMMEELASYLPGVKSTLIDERDQYLASKIWESTEKLDHEKCKIVAVVGAGHMKGIKNHLDKISEGKQNADVSCLNDVKSKKLFSNIAPFLVPVVILGLIGFGFFTRGAEMSFAMLRQYFLWNGSLAAFGTIIALGHPLSVLAAFITAPITTVTPFIGVGMFAGLIQAIMKKPRVEDAQNIIDDVGSIRGLYRNRITRALLVFFLTQLGGVAGTFVTVPLFTAGLLPS